MTQLPNSVKSRLRSAANSGASGHPDANLLNAFAEQALAAPEREEVLGHLAQCAECREIVALTMTTAANASAEAAGRGWFGWRPEVLRWGVVAASATVVVAAVFLVRPELRESRSSESAGLRQEKMIAQKQAAAEADASARAAKDAAPVVSAGAVKPATQGSAAGQRGRADARPAAPPSSRMEAISDGRAETRNEPTQGLAMAPAPPAAAEQAASGAERKSANADETLPLQKRSVAPQTTQHYSLADLDAAKTKPEATNDNVVASGSMESKVKDDGKARDSGPAMYSTMNSKAVGGAVPAKERELRAARMKGEESQPRTWRILEGKLESSRDGGKTWARADAPGGARFLAVDARRANVWAGGTSGVVIRSDDNGATWVPVTTGWTGDVTYLKFDDEKHGTLKTSTGEEWFTDDGGASWKKK